MSNDYAFKSMEISSHKLTNQHDGCNNQSNNHLSNHSPINTSSPNDPLNKHSFFKNSSSSHFDEDRAFKYNLSDASEKQEKEEKTINISYPPSVHFNEKKANDRCVDKCSASNSKYQAVDDKSFHSNKYNHSFMNQQRAPSSSQNFPSRPADFTPFPLLVSPASSARISFLASKLLSPNTPPVHQPFSNHSYPFSNHFNSPYHYQKSGFYPHLSHQHLDTNSGLEGSGCRLIEYRGAQVAAFRVETRELICLPQAFDLFLKNLVGGLHTVYTKLKRLDITPVVCNVEQVRILRGLGAIQPGVNRCKLISPQEFDVLYEDCTNSSARPGRPPKRSPLSNSNETLSESIKRPKINNFSEYFSQNRLLEGTKTAGYCFDAHQRGMVGSGPSVLSPLSTFSHNYLPFLQGTRFQHFQQPLQARNMFQKRNHEVAKSENEAMSKNLLEMFKAGMNVGESKETQGWEMPSKFDQLATSSPPFPLPFNITLPMNSMQQFPMPVFNPSSSSCASSSSDLLYARSSVNSFMPMLNFSPYNSLFNLAFSAAAIANYKNRMRKDLDHSAEKNSPNESNGRQVQDIYSKAEETPNNNLQNCLNMRLLKTQPDIMKDLSSQYRLSVDNIKNLFRNNQSAMENAIWNHIREKEKPEPLLDSRTDKNQDCKAVREPLNSDEDADDLNLEIDDGKKTDDLETTPKKKAGYSINWLLNKKCNDDEGDVRKKDEENLNQSTLIQTKDSQNKIHFSNLEKNVSDMQTKEDSSFLSVGESIIDCSKSSKITNGVIKDDVKTDRKIIKEVLRCKEEEESIKEIEDLKGLSRQAQYDSMKQRMKPQKDNKSMYPFDILFSNVETVFKVANNNKNNNNYLEYKHKIEKEMLLEKLEKEKSKRMKYEGELKKLIGQSLSQEISPHASPVNLSPVSSHSVDASSRELN